MEILAVLSYYSPSPQQDEKWRKPTNLINRSWGKPVWQIKGGRCVSKVFIGICMEIFILCVIFCLLMIDIKL